jgi:hypothetical protein
MSDFWQWALIRSSLAYSYKQAGNIDKAIEICRKIFAREIEEDEKYHDLNLHIFYAECLIDPSVRSKDNLSEAYQVFELMDHYAYEAQQKLAVQFGLAFCWMHEIPKKPKSEDIDPIGRKILEAFDEDWNIQPAFEEKERILRQWSRQLNLFIDKFSVLVPNISWEICEMMRSRFLLIDLGHSMKNLLTSLPNDLIREEAELASKLRELNDKIKQQRESPPAQDSFSQLEKLYGPTSIASLDKQRKTVSRELDYIRYQLSQSSERDKENIDMRTGDSISYSDLQELLTVS